MTKIYDNIPVPSRSYARKAKYNFAALTNIGQSMFFESKEGEEIAETQKRINGAVQRFRKLNDNKELRFAVRQGDHPETLMPAIGVWRVA